MGLLALAYYQDRTEAYVVRSMLSDAGILAIIGNEDWLRMLPHHTQALGGYRILVSDLDLEDAIAVIHEAMASPLRGGEALVVRGDIVDRVLAPVIGWLAGGVATPLRTYDWVEDDTASAAMLPPSD